MTANSRSTPSIPPQTEADAAVSGPSVAVIDAEVLARLADTVLTKSPADLAALAAANPSVAKAWTEAFGRAKARAEAEARFWSAAAASLSTVAPARFALAAE